MGRKRQVSRTLTETTVTLLAVEVSSNTVYNAVCTAVSVQHYTNDKLLDKFRREAPTGIVYAAIIDRHEEDFVFAMDENEFYARAEKLPPRYLDAEVAEAGN